MKHSQPSWPLLLAVAALLPGCSTQKDELDATSACPPGNVAPAHQPAQHAQEASTPLDSTWRKAASVSPGKFPSGIETHYRIGHAEAQPLGMFQLELRFSNVGSTPAMAMVYGFDGASVHASSSPVLILKKDKDNGVRLTVQANKEGAGGFAIMTCQNQKKSVISIDIPAS